MSQPAIGAPPLSWWSRFAAVVREIIGAPNYEKYVAYMTANHPECSLLSRDAFFKERMNQKYTQPGSRCC
ncbi:MAG: YbdD/YjiX family protein [Gemmatimonas sp.]